jgi:hypothetical protein
MLPSYSFCPNCGSPGQKSLLCIMFQPNPDRMRLKKVLVGRSDE